MNDSLRDKVALVAGAGSGIGAATARRLAAAGAKVALLSRTKEADLVYFLASDLSSHITGTEVWIDGGESLLKG